MTSATIQQANHVIAATYKRFPIVLTRGCGCTLWDESDKAYTDFVAGIAVCNLGHAHPQVAEALCRQVAREAEAQRADHQREHRHPPAEGRGLEEIDRARSMALIHETLYRTGNFSKVDMEVYLSTLVSQLAGSYARNRKIRMIVDIPGIFLDLSRATTTGLIVSELITNSFKYAFPPSFDGPPPEVLKHLGLA